MPAYAVRAVSTPGWLQIGRLRQQRRVRVRQRRRLRRARRVEGVRGERSSLGGALLPVPPLPAAAPPAEEVPQGDHRHRPVVGGAGRLPRRRLAQHRCVPAVAHRPARRASRSDSAERI
eukprot:4531953-Pyramimonas_sp.AAC.2